MKRRFGTHDMWVGILSAGRPGNVRAMVEKVGQVTWYVQPDEQAAYRAAGALHVRDAHKGVGPARNCILRDGYDMGLDTIYMDDDLRRIQRAMVVEGHDARKGVDITFDDAVTLMADRLYATDFYLAGAAPTNNAYFTHQDTSTNLFVIGSFHIVRAGCKLLVDEAPALAVHGLAFTKEDYDYTLQHIRTYGGALRCNDVIFDWQHYSNPGGVKPQRTVVSEEASIRYLMRKWPGEVKRHPRRKREVMLSVKRRARTVV